MGLEPFDQQQALAEANRHDIRAGMKAP